MQRWRNHKARSYCLKGKAKCPLGSIASIQPRSGHVRVPANADRRGAALRSLVDDLLASAAGRRASAALLWQNLPVAIRTLDPNLGKIVLADFINVPRSSSSGIFVKDACGSEGADFDASAGLSMTKYGNRLGSSVRLVEKGIECDVLRGFGQGEIHAVSAFVAGGKCSIGGDGHIVGICVVVGMHDAVDARTGDLLAGPEGVRTHVIVPFRPLLVLRG
jgi:hypothetical protein